MTKEEAFEKWWAEVLDSQGKVSESFDDLDGHDLQRFTRRLEPSFRETWIEAWRQARREAFRECEKLAEGFAEEAIKEPDTHCCEMACLACHKEHHADAFKQIAEEYRALIESEERGEGNHAGG